MTSLDDRQVRYDRDTDGVVMVTLDTPGPVFAMNAGLREALIVVVERLEREDGLSGVIFGSPGKRPPAGAVPQDSADRERSYAALRLVNDSLRRIERLPVPVVAAIDGTAAGAGLELCLACNRRIAVSSAEPILGLPEVTLGLLPGAGGIARSIHLLGLEKALPLAVEGRMLRPDEARAIGWVDETVETAAELLPAAKAWIRDNPNAGTQPWDIKGHRIPGGDIRNPVIQYALRAASTMVFKKTRGELPAPQSVLSAAAETVAISFDAALRVHESLFVDLLLRTKTKDRPAAAIA